LGAVAEPAAAPRQLLTFFIAGEEYAFDILEVREIVACGHLTPVPSMPPAVRGVMNLRGNVVPVVDLAALFGLAATPLRPRTCVVIVAAHLGGERTRLGVLGDAVGEVFDPAADEIERPPEFGTRARPETLRGIARRDGRFVLILALDALLAQLDPGEAPAPWQRAPEPNVTQGRSSAGSS
jgi:purine-binding chemotaxis protein CheW